ncbi:MAG: glycosyltransferase [Kiritimatiellia bacterium]
MNTPANSAPDVTIIIPYHNCQDLTLSCLKSLVKTSQEVDWELVLINDASDHEIDLDWMSGSDRRRVTHLHNSERKSYSLNNNLAAEVAKSDLLCLLNNDTLLCPGWLSSLLAVARNQPDLGVLGNLHLYPDGKTVQHSGMGFDQEGKPYHLNPGASRYAPSVGYQREFQCVTFACVLIPRAVYRQLSGLDPAYRNGFEDCDFCLRAREAGYRVLYHPASRIIHYGQSTSGRTDHDNANWILFQKRWKDNIQKDLETLEKEDKEINSRESRTRPRPHRHGLHISIDVEVPNAFLWATVDLIGALERKGVPLSLNKQPGIHPSISRTNRKALRRLMSFSPRESYHIKWTHYWPHHYSQPLFGDINAEFFCTNYRYRPDSPHLDLWMRHVQVNEYRKLPVAGFNQEALKDIGVPGSQCKIMPLGYSPEIDTLFPLSTFTRSSPGEDLHILLVTNSHDLYRYGTDLAVRALSEAFGPEDPVVVHIKDYGGSSGGSQLEEWIRNCKRFPRIHWHRGFVSKEALLHLYAGMDLQLAPFRGEGFSMKILDAAALGVPTLMPAFGGPMEFSKPGTFIPLPFREVPVGRCYDQDNFYLGEGAYWCEPDIDPMIEALCACLKDRSRLQHIGETAMRHVRPAYSWDAAADHLMQALEDWQSQRQVVVGTRQQPSCKAMTVIIPTKDREDILDLTLKAYSEQRMPARDFELLLVNDHGDVSKVKAVADKYPSLNLKLLNNEGPGGPAAARNLAIEQSRGEVVLISGDDIIPHPDFLSTHLLGHQKYPESTAAFVGFTDWHPDLPQTPFMKHITGEGGQQFKYNDMQDDHVVPFDRLYTSNCSIKRSFLNQEEILFSTRYRYAAYEDVELGYRLHLRGMKLRHLAHAIGYHHHEITPESFLRRQRLTGRMLTLLTLQRPGYVPNEHSLFLKALEFFHAHPGARAPALDAVDPEILIDQMGKICRAMIDLPSELDQQPHEFLMVQQDALLWSHWLRQGNASVWESLNQLILRVGMVEEWADTTTPDPKASAWISLVLMPNITGFRGMDWNMPYSRPEFTSHLAPNSKLLYHVAKRVRQFPLLGPALHSFEHSPAGQYTRSYLQKILMR